MHRDESSRHRFFKIWSRWYAPTGDKKSPNHKHLPVALLDRIWAAERLEARLLLSGITPNGVWTGGGNGSSWSDPLNWSNNVLPGPNDDVVINAAGGATVVHDSTIDTVHSLSASTPLLLSGGELQLSSTSSVSVLTQSGGTLDGSGDLTITSNLTWSGGTESGTGQTLILGASAEADLTSSEILDGREMDIDAAFISIRGSNFLMKDGALLNLNGGGANLSLAQGTSILNFGGAIPKINLSALTSFTMTSGSGSSQIQPDLTIGGNVSVSGELILNGGAEDLGGNLTVNSGAVLELAATSVNLHTSSVSGSGDVRLENGTLLVNTPVSMPNLTQSAGTLDGSGDLTITSNFNWSGGTETGSGRTHIASSTHAQLPNSEILDGREFDVDGGFFSVSGSNFLMKDGAVVNLNAGAVLLLAQGTSILNFGGAEPKLNIDSQSSLSMSSSGSGLSQLQADLTISGSATVNGSLQLAGNVDDVTGNVTVNAGGTLIIAQGNSLAFETTSFFENDGLLRVTSGQTLLASEIHGPGSLSLEGGELTLSVLQSIPTLTQSGGTLDGSGSLSITGNLTWSGGTESGTGQTLIAGSAEADLTNSEILDGRETDIDAAFISISGSNFLMKDGAALKLNGGGASLSLAQGTSILNFGGALPQINFSALTSFTLASGSGSSQIQPNLTTSANFFVNGDLILDGSSDDLGGNLTVNSGAVLELAATSVNLHSSSVSGSGDVRLENGTLLVNTPVSMPNLTQSSGTVDGTSNLTITSNLIWSGGTETGTGQTHIAALAQAQLPTSEILDGREFDVDGGVLSVSGSNFLMKDGAVLNLNGGAALLLAQGTSILNFGGAAPKLNINAQSTLSVSSSGSGASRILVDINDSGTLSILSSQVQVTNLIQNPGSDLEIQISGSAAGQFGELVASGTAVLGGSLNVTLANGFTPKNNDTFDILDATAISGHFSDTHLPIFSNGQITLTQTATNLSLSTAALNNGVWTGLGDGHSWGDPNNWSNDVLPGSSDDVLIHDSNGHVVIHDANDDTVHSLTATTAILLSGGTLTLLAPSTAIDFNQSGGVLTGADLTVTDELDWQRGTQTGPGTTHIPVDAILNLMDSPEMDGRHFVVDGTANLSGSALFMDDGAIFDDNGTFNIQGDQGILTNIGVTPTFNISTGGVLEKNGGGQDSEIAVNLNSQGTIFLDTGRLTLDGPQVVLDGPTAAAAVTELVINSPSFTLGSSLAASITGDGAITFAGGSATIQGAYLVGGLTTLAGGTLTLQHGVGVTNFDQSGGTVSGPGDLTVNGIFNWSNGAQSGGGTTHIGSDAVLNLTDIAELDDRTMEMSGTTNFTGSTFFMGIGAVFNVDAGGGFFIGGQQQILYNGLGAQPTFKLTDAGTLVLQDAADAVIEVDFNNQALVGFNAGKLLLSGQNDIIGGTWIGGDGTLTVAAANTLFNGSFDELSDPHKSANVIFDGGNVTIDGGFAPTGLTTLKSGAVTLKQSVTLPNFDQLAGTLNGPGDLTVNGIFNWVKGAQSGGGTTHIPQNATLNLTDTEGLDGRTFDMEGTANFTGAALIMDDGAIFNVDGSGSFFIDGGQQILFGGLGSEPQFNTSLVGALIKQGDQTAIIDVDFNDHAVANIQAGGLVLGGHSTVIDGVLNVGGATLTLSADTTELNASFNVGVDPSLIGNIVFENGTATVDHVFNPTGLTTLNSGTLKLNVPLTLGAFEQHAGTLTGAADLTVTGLFTWDNGSQSGTGTTHIPVNATIALTGVMGLDGRRLDMAGNANFTGQTLFMDDGAIIDDSGDFELSGGQQILFDDLGSEPQFNILTGGSLVIPGNGGALMEPNLDNAGMLKIDSGSLVTGGSYTQHISGTLEIHVGGAVQPQFGQLEVSGPTTLAGTLTVLLDNSFFPASGDHFEIVTAGAVSGAFSPINLPDDPIARLQESQDAISVSIDAGTNHAPVANPDSVTTLSGIAVQIPVLLNDSDPDGDTLTIQSFTQGVGGTVTLGPTADQLTYTPFASGSFTDSFTYTISDGHGGLATASVIVTVNSSGGGEDAAFASSALSTGLSGLHLDLGSWGSLFNLGNFGTFLPVIGDKLSDLFGLGGNGGALAGLSLPSFSSANSFSQLSQNLQAAGFTVDSVPADGSRLSDTNFLQLHLLRDLNLSSSSEFDDRTNSFLSGILATLDLNGLINFNASSLHLKLDLGVDDNGFFVVGDSGIELDIGGDGGTLTGDTPASAQQVSAAGNASADYQVKLLGPGNGHLRLTDPSLSSGSFFTFRSDGTASVSADMHFSPIDLHLSAAWSLTDTNNTISNTVIGSGTLHIPTLQVTKDGQATDDSVSLAAVFANDIWTIDGGIDLNPHTLAGFKLNALHAHASINGTNVSGNIDGQMEVDPENSSPVQIGLSAGFDNNHFHADATVSKDNLFVGLQASQSLLWIHHGTFGLTLDSDFQGGTTIASVSATADVAVVLPQPTSDPNAQPNGVATVNNFNGSIDSKGHLTLHADSFSITATPALLITGGQIDLDIDPQNTNPSAVIASLHDLVITPAAFSALSNNTLTLLQIRRNGFDLVDDLTLPNGTLDKVASVTGPALHLNLHYTTGSSPALTGSVGFTADTAGFFASGLASVTGTGLSGSIDIATADVTLTAQSAQVLLDNLLDVQLTGTTFSFGPGVTGLLHVDTATATIPGLTGPTFEVDNLTVNTDGTAVFTRVFLSDSGGLLQDVALGGILPFDITSIEATLSDPTDLSTLALTATGSFDLSGLTLPFTPTITIGDGQPNTIKFVLDINQLKDEQIVPQTLPDISLGFSGLHLDPAVLGGSIEFQNFVNGRYTTIGGSANVSAGLGDISGNASITLGGSISTVGDQTTLDVNGAFNLGFSLGNGAISIQNAGLSFNLKITNTPQVDRPVNLSFNTTFGGAHIGGIAVDFAGLFSFAVHDVAMNFNPAPNTPMFQFGTVNLTLDGGISELTGLSGTASNFGIGSDGALYLLGHTSFIFSPGNMTLGLPSWIPFHVDSLGIIFQSGFFDSNIGEITGATRIADPTAFSLEISASLGKQGEFPFNASVQNLVLDMDALRHNRFPITSVSGGGFGLQPTQIGPILVAGFLNFGQTNAGNFFLDIGGEFGIDGLGDVGGRLIVSQFGPIEGSISVPLAVPIGPTGLVLTSVSGGIVFGQKPTSFTDASQLTRSDIPNVPQNLDAAQIAGLVDSTAAAGKDLWQQDFTVALSGNLIYAAAPGLASAKLTLALNTGGQLAAAGSVDALGIPFADAIMLLDLTKTDPKILARIAWPSPGSPLGFLLPDQSDFQFTFDGTGLTEGLIFGLRAFFQRAISGTESIANSYVGSVLDAVADDLQAHRDTPLAQQLLLGNPNATIDRTFLINRVLALLPSELANVEADLTSIGTVAQNIFTEILNTAANVSLDPASLSASENQSISSIESLIGNLAGNDAVALAALIGNLRDAAIAGASAFESAFNPLIDISGSIQPVVLGIPFGPPVAGAHVGITKSGLVFGANISPSGLLDESLKATPGISAVWDTLKFLMPIPFDLTGAEHLSANVELPFDASFLSFAEGQVPVIDPFSPNWLVSIGGSVSPFGIQLASITGAAFTTGNPAATTLFQVAANFSDAFNPVDPSKIIVSSQQRLNQVLALGGLILNSQVLLPSLLLDPGNLFKSLPPIPSNPLDLPGYVSDLVTRLSSYSQLGRVQFFVPSPQTLLQFNLLNFGGATPRVAPSAAFLAESPTQQAADLQNLIDSAYIEGVLNARILGIQLASGILSGTAQQFSINGTIPWLANLQTSFNVSFVPRPIPDSAFVAIYGRQPTSSELNPDGTANIQFPVVGAQASLNSNTAISGILQGFGLDPIFFTTLFPSAVASFKAFSPLFDPASADPIEQIGGIEFDADLSIPGLLNRSTFKFALTPPADGSLIPDFDASVSAVNLQPLAGLSITNATVHLIETGGHLTVTVDGTATFLGTTVQVHGNLSPDLTGTLFITAQTGKHITVGGFTLDAGLTLTLSRIAGILAGSISFDGNVGLPGWLSAATGQATAQASGTVNNNGNFTFTLAITSFAVGGTSTGISLVSADGKSSATFTLAHNATSTTLSVSGGIQFSAKTGLPLLAVSGSFSDTVGGTGTFTITLGTNSNPLNLSSFALRGSATLTIKSPNFAISVNGHLSVNGLFTNATVTGAIDQNGISRLAVGASSLALSPVTVNSFSILLLRSISALGIISYQLHVHANVSIPNVLNNVDVDGNFDSTGSGGLTLAASSLSLFGFSLTSGTFTLNVSASAITLSMTASMSFLGVNFDVSTPTPLAIATGGPSGTISLSVSDDARFSFDGWSVGGTLTLAVTRTSANFTVTSGTLSIPGLFTNLAVGGTFNSNGLGMLMVGAPGTVIQPGGSRSPFTISGTYNLLRSQSGTNAPVTTFSATNASFTWTGVMTLTIPTFTASSNGQFSVRLNPINLNLGGTGGLSFNMGVVIFQADALGLNLKLHFGSATLSIPNVATGASALSIPAFDVNTTGDFSVALVSANAMNFGVIQITGQLLFQRQNGVFSLAIQDIPNGLSSISPRLTIPGLGTIILNTFTISADATFSVSATSTQIGPSALSIHNAAFTIAKTGAALSTFSITITGGKLFLPVGGPIALPTLSIQSDGTFNPNNVALTVPSLSFGAAFNVNSTSTFNLSLAGGVLALIQSGSVTVNVLGASLTLKNLDIESNGTFTGSVTGRLQVLGFTLGSATLNISQSGGVVTMTLPSSSPARLDLGFAKVNLSGFVNSNGHFSLTGSTSVAASVFGLATASGTATFTLSDTGGFVGTYSGSFSALGQNLANASGTITSSGLLTVIVLGQPVSLQL